MTAARFANPGSAPPAARGAGTGTGTLEPDDTAPGLAPEVAVLLLAQALPHERAWLLGRLVRGPRALRHDRGLRFARVLGCGHEGGFGLRPAFDRGGLFALFDHEDDALRFVDHSAVIDGYRRRTRELLVAVLRATSVRGRWGGASMRVTASAVPGMPVASLTRASIRPLRAATFWRHAAPAEAALAAAPGCLLHAGLGEAPLLRQATFSLWRDTASLEAYARGGAHRAAIDTAWHQRCFSESMFVRFAPLRLAGRWMEQVHDLRLSPAENAHG